MSDIQETGSLYYCSLLYGPTPFSYILLTIHSVTVRMASESTRQGEDCVRIAALKAFKHRGNNIPRGSRETIRR